METLRKLLKELDDKSVSGIYLREIALLMEEIEALKGELRVRQNLIENYEKQLKDKNEYKGRNSC